MKQFVIIPGCSDLNRGDQALVWETKRLAEEAGLVGEFYLTSEKNEPVDQSVKEGIKIIPPILEHPSRKFKNKDNIHYTKSLKAKWGMVALFDFIGSMLLLCGITRKIALYFLPKEKRESFEKMKGATAIFMKGGGLLQTHGGISSTYSMYFWVFPILLAHKLKVPVFVMPNSFGPFEGPFVKKIAKLALSKCRIVTSRETISQQMVKEQLGLNIDNYPDLAFMLQKSELSKNEVYDRFNLPQNKKLVAITMRPYRFPTSPNPTKAYEQFKEEMAYFIKWLYEYNYMPVIVEHTLAVNTHENDGACIQDVVKMLKKDQYRLVSDHNFNCHDLKCIYSFCDYIVGTRFHSVIFSLSSGVPGIAIAYVGNKSQGIMKDIGLEDYVLSIDEVTSSKLIEKFEALIKNENDVKKRISSYLETVKPRYDTLCSLVRKCINE